MRVILAVLAIPVGVDFGFLLGVGLTACVMSALGDMGLAGAAILIPCIGMTVLASVFCGALAASLAWRAPGTKARRIDPLTVLCAMLALDVGGHLILRAFGK